MKLYESKFQRIYYDKQFSMMEFKWLASATERTEEELKEEEAIHVELLNQYKPLLVMSDVHNIHFADAKHLEEWVRQEYAKIIEYAPQGQTVRMAVQTQAEFAEQLFKDEDEEEELLKKNLPQIQYFSDEIQAELWLLGDER
jgi:hypothetical protein